MPRNTEEGRGAETQRISLDSILAPEQQPRLLADVVEIVSAAAERAVRGFGGSTPRIKWDGSYVTEHDKAVEEILRNEIHDRFPDHGFLGEEEGLSGNSSSQCLWVLDPIDGTSNYVNGVPFWAISVALIIQNVPVLGILQLPMQSQTFTAIKGKGSFLNEKRLVVPPKREMRSADLFGITAEAAKDYDFHLPQKLRAMGSAAAQIAYVACGFFVGYFMDTWYLWDIAAAFLIAQEAGVKAVDLEGRDYEEFKCLHAYQGPPLLLCAPAMVKELLPNISRKPNPESAGRPK